MFIIRNIGLPEHNFLVDIKHVTATGDSPDLSDSLAELAYSMLKSFTPQTGIGPIDEENILVYIWWDGEPLAPKVPVSDRRSL